MSVKIPIVSIVMPVYNRENLIAKSLDSIRNQTYKNWECIIIDDRSTDNTKEVVQDFLNKDDRFMLFSRSDEHLKGPSGCRNQGIELSRGEYIIFFDSDDIVHPDNLMICLDVLSRKNYDFCRYDKAPFVGTWSPEYSFEKQNSEIEDFTLADISRMVTMEMGFACCTVMWKKNCLSGMRFDENLSYAEEWEYYTRLLSQGNSGASINEILYFNRKHPDSNTGQFWSQDPLRKQSKVKAVELVINHLQQKKLLSPELVNYFIRLGFFLDSSFLLDHILRNSNSGILKRIKYKIGYKIYPLLRPLLRLKGKIIE